MSARKHITYSSRPNHAARAAHAKGDKQFRSYDTSHIIPKKSKAPIVVGIVLALLVVAALVAGYFFIFAQDDPDLLADGETIELTIPEGAGARDIGTLLEENRVIASSRDFVNRVNEMGADSSLLPGDYTFTGGMSSDDIVVMLQAGPVVNTFTVPEGYTARQVADKVQEAYEGSITAEDFLACVNNAEQYVNDFSFTEGAYQNSLEGFLFPKTYKIEKDATADSVVRQMLSQYQSETSGIDMSYADGKGLSSYQVLILASLIEREAVLDEERPKVSSVIYNRLADDMRLQIDATIAYAKGSADVTGDDLSIDSPYNTYEHDGLPPGPICSPGTASLIAAAQPEETNFYYYVVTGAEDGAHYFAETYEEHQANITKSDNA